MQLSSSRSADLFENLLEVRIVVEQIERSSLSPLAQAVRRRYELSGPQWPTSTIRLASHHRYILCTIHPFRPAFRAGFGGIRPAEDRQHAIDRHDEQPVVVLQLDRDRLARVEQHLVILADRLVLVVLDRLADRDHPAGDDGNLVAVGQDDAALGLALVVVLADDDALADRLDDVVLGRRLGTGLVDIAWGLYAE